MNQQIGLDKFLVPATRVADVGQRLSSTKFSIKMRLFGKLVLQMWTSSKLGLRSKAVVSTSKTRGARHQPT